MLFYILCALESIRIILILLAGIAIVRSFCSKNHQEGWFKVSLMAGYNLCLGIVSVPLLIAYYSSTGGHVNWLNLLADLLITLFVIVVCLRAFFKQARE